MHSTRADPAARGPARAKAPSKVSVNKCADRGSLILPWEMIDHTGLQDQVPAQAQEGRPIG
eukprot:6709784-Alexandrium_andersonii.AAC.1